MDEDLSEAALHALVVEAMAGKSLEEIDDAILAGLFKWDHPVDTEIRQAFKSLTGVTDAELEKGSRSVMLTRALVVFTGLVEAVRLVLKERRANKPSTLSVWAIAEVNQLYLAFVDDLILRRRLVGIITRSVGHMRAGRANAALAAIHLMTRAQVEIDPAFGGLDEHFRELVDALQGLSKGRLGQGALAKIAALMSSRVGWLGDRETTARGRFRSALDKAIKWR